MRKVRFFIDERSEIATEPAVRRLRGHDRAREETNAYQRYDLIPRSSAAEATSNRRFDVAGAGRELQFEPCGIIPFIEATVKQPAFIIGSFLLY